MNCMVSIYMFHVCDTFIITHIHLIYDGLPVILQLEFFNFIFYFSSYKDILVQIPLPYQILRGDVQTAFQIEQK